LLILDLDGCEPAGLNMLGQARRMVPWMASLAIVEHAAVPCAIKAIRAGAGDCLDKPVSQDRLLAAVETQLARLDGVTRRRPGPLTEMEVQILQFVLAGETSHDMAAELHRSKRTIESHRKNIMRKLQATGLVDLIRRALAMGFSDQPQREPDGQEEGSNDP
jgi:FixJ family two-component response regulator